MSHLWWEGGMFFQFLFMSMESGELWFCGRILEAVFAMEEDVDKPAVSVVRA